jgi:hypothetical protein
MPVHYSTNGHLDFISMPNKNVLGNSSSFVIHQELGIYLLQLLF